LVHLKHEIGSKNMQGNQQTVVSGCGASPSWDPRFTNVSLAVSVYVHAFNEESIFSSICLGIDEALPTLRRVRRNGPFVEDHMHRHEDAVEPTGVTQEQVNEVFSQLTPKQQTMLRLLHEAGALKPLLDDLRRNLELAQADPAGKA
jgi:hypothetical protein